jgi:hypothetical protein
MVSKDFGSESLHTILKDCGQLDTFAKLHKPNSIRLPAQKSDGSN